MSVEKRMDEFKQVANKQKSHDIPKQMDEFQKVPKMKSKQDTFGELPYHVKRYRICDTCSDPMEIQELQKNKAIYYCKTCNKKFEITINE